jgi:hypothetical protein
MVIRDSECRFHWPLLSISLMNEAREPGVGHAAIRTFSLWRPLMSLLRKLDRSVPAHPELHKRQPANNAEKLDALAFGRAGCSDETFERNRQVRNLPLAERFGYSLFDVVFSP